MNSMKNANKKYAYHFSRTLLFYIISGLSYLFYTPVYATTLQLTINPVQSMIAGVLPDKKLLAVSHLHYSAPHCGFKITVHAVNHNQLPNHYTLTNNISSYDHLNVQLIPQDHVPSTQQPNGLVVMDPADDLNIAILSANSQQVAATRFPLTLSASVILCH